jgi:hypothetical protein
MLVFFKKINTCFLETHTHTSSTHTHTHTHTHVCMHACTCIFIYLGRCHMSEKKKDASSCIDTYTIVYVYVCMYVSLYLSIYLSIYIHTHTHTHTHTHVKRGNRRPRCVSTTCTSCISSLLHVQVSISARLVSASVFALLYQ